LLSLPRCKYHFNPLKGRCGSLGGSGPQDAFLLMSEKPDRCGSHLSRNSIGMQHKALATGGIWSVSLRDGWLSVFYDVSMIHEHRLRPGTQYLPVLWARRACVRDKTASPAAGKGNGRNRACNMPRKPRPDSVVVPCSSAQLHVIPHSHITLYGGSGSTQEIALALLQAQHQQSALVKADLRELTRASQWDRDQSEGAQF